MGRDFPARPHNPIPGPQVESEGNEDDENADAGPDQCTEGVSREAGDQMEVETARCPDKGRSPRFADSVYFQEVRKTLGPLMAHSIHTTTTMMTGASFTCYSSG